LQLFFSYFSVTFATTNYLKEDKYSFLATDAHQRFTRYQELERDLQLIEKEIGLEELEYLILYNPMQIINSK